MAKIEKNIIKTTLKCTFIFMLFVLMGALVLRAIHVKILYAPVVWAAKHANFMHLCCNLQEITTIFVWLYLILLR
jgi:hypothetical protein